VLEPRVEFLEGTRVQRVESPASLHSCAHKTVLAENAKVPGHAGPCRVEVRRELTRTALSVREQLDDPEPCRIREGRERVQRDASKRSSARDQAAT
jgi:hypothetical protein